jgi:hypothetical protein
MGPVEGALLGSKKMMVATLAGNAIVRPRVDLRSWARAIVKDENWWVYRGVARPSGTPLQRMNSRNDKEKYSNKFAAMLLSDETYLERIATEEVEFYIRDNTYADEWEDRCKRLAHREGRCPHVAEENAAFQKELDALRHNEDKKRQWLWEAYIDYEFIREQVLEWSTEEESIFYFLKEHPIEGCFRAGKHGGAWTYLRLDEIAGWCFECNQPLGNDSFYEACPGCYSTWDADVDNDVIATYGRPFDWPPNAPWPARTHFDGSPLLVGPWEE